MGVHLKEEDGVVTFQSDKYPACPAGKVPLSVKDKDAQDLLWTYAQRHRARDGEFSADLEQALRNAGYDAGREDVWIIRHTAASDRTYLTPTQQWSPRQAFALRFADRCQALAMALIFRKEGNYCSVRRLKPRRS